MRKALTLIIVILVCGGFIDAQTVQVTGVVRNSADGRALAGATVMVRGSKTFSITSSEGRYAIDLPPSGEVIEFSMIGFKTVVENVGGRSVIDVEMTEEVLDLDEVVVVGYGSGQKLGTVVGSVKRISAENIRERPSTNTLDALQGKVAGVQIYTSSGEPSAESSIRLHGHGSLGAGSTPLFVVDGISVDAATFQAMNRNDFESITFLKDASATSIYGARAANGVVYATTKKGHTNRDAEIALTAQYSLSSLANRDFYNSFMNARQLSDFWVETGFRTRKQVDELLAEYHYDTRWVDYYYRNNAPTLEGLLTVSGGGGATSYYISGGYYDAEGIVPRSNYRRYTLHANIESAVKKWIKLGLNTNVLYGKRNTNAWMGTNSVNGGLFWLTQPFYTPYNPKTGERYDYIPGADKYSPWYLADKQPMDNSDVRLNTSAYIEISPVEGLTIVSRHGLDGCDLRESSVRMPSFMQNLKNGKRTEKFSRDYVYTMTNTVEYRFALPSGYKATLLGGQEFIDSDNSSFLASSEGITDDRLTLLGNGNINKNVEQKRSQYAYFSLFGRLNCSFADRYHANINVREDRSSRFGANNRSAVFVSGGIMWDIRKESFMTDVRAVTDLRIRASYGSSGNSSIGNYEHLSTVGTNRYMNAPGWSVSSPGNSNLSWETQNVLSIAANIGLFNIVSLELEFYDRRTSNMLMSVPYPYTSGFANIRSNVGKLLNRGIDVTLDIHALATPEWNVNFSATFNYNTNRVLELFQGRRQWTVPNTGVSYVVGKPVMFYYPLYAGVDPADGSQQWFLPDAADNSTVTRDPSRVTKTFAAAALEQNTGKQRYTPVTGGFGFNAEYRGLKIDAYFTFALGKYILNNDRFFSSNPANFAGYNQHVEVANYWKKPGDRTPFPRYGETMQFDDHLIENASFMRLKSLTLSYVMPKSLIARTRFFAGARIFITGRNLLTFTRYNGPEPEIDSNLTYGACPNTRQYSAGIELKF